MSKKLVLAEKPSVGNEIAKILGCKNKQKGYIEGENHIVTWAFGHLVTLADPDMYHKKYGTWKLEDLPILPDVLKLVVIRQSANQYKLVTSLMNRKDVNQIIIATDAGREGELVARWIIEKANINKPIKRLWVSSVTEKALKQGFKSLRDGRDYENLYAAAIARAESDWIVGINATRALTTKYNAQLSCGRVQTPTIAMVAQREEEIRQFVSKTFYGLQGEKEGVLFEWVDQKTKATRLFDEQVVKAVYDKVKNQVAKIVDIQSKERLIFSPALYDLTELQRDSFNRYNYSAKKTLSIMQSLYESHKAVTYPRTDSRFLTDDIVATIPERLSAISIDPYKNLAFQLKKQTIKLSNRVVDNDKVSDHHAIIPTEESPLLGNLSFEERNIYELIVKRFISVLMPPCRYQETTIKIQVCGEIFIAKGVQIIQEGWKKTDPNTFSDKILPNYHVGQSLTHVSFNVTNGKTKPPGQFNEATLLSAMEKPTRFMGSSDKNLKNIIERTGGLGTVATRADIIEKLFNTQLLEVRGNQIFTTSKGKQLLKLAPEDLKSPLLTAKWESRLNQIAEGKLKKDDFVKEMRVYTTKIIQDIKGSDETFRHDNLSTTPCPECGKTLLEVNNKYGKNLVCQDRSCGHKQVLSRKTNARCSNCHQKLEIVGTGDNQTFICRKCGQREKLKSFEERKKSQKNKGGKQDYNKYKQKVEKIEKQVAEEDNPFAKLAKLKLDQ